MNLQFQNITKWKSSYQRNNKQKGLKNLRCFPYCSSRHVSNNFCGQPIEVTFTFSEEDIKPERLCFCGEFHLADQPPSVLTKASFAVGKIKPLLRRIGHLRNPLYKGVIVKQVNNCLTVHFNHQLEGWHYGWLSNRYTASSAHVFRATALYIVEDELKVLSSGSSPRFSIYCRRRSRQKHKVNAFPIEDFKLEKKKKGRQWDNESKVWIIIEAFVEQQRRSKNHCNADTAGMSDFELSEMLDLLVPDIGVEDADDLFSVDFDFSFPSTPQNTIENILHLLGDLLIKEKLCASVLARYKENSPDIRKANWSLALATTMETFLLQHNHTLDSFAKELLGNFTKPEKISHHFVGLASPSLALEIPDNEPFSDLDFSERYKIFKQIERSLTGVWSVNEDLMSDLRSIRSKLFPKFIQDLLNRAEEVHTYSFLDTSQEAFEEGKSKIVWHGNGYFMLTDALVMSLNDTESSHFGFIPLPTFIINKFMIPTTRLFIEYESRSLFWISYHGQLKRIVRINRVEGEKRVFTLVYQTRNTESDKWKTELCSEHVPTRLKQA